jgi:hypothetical protein
LDCGSPLPLCVASLAVEKRQGAAAVQDADAQFAHPNRPDGRGIFETALAFSPSAFSAFFLRLLSLRLCLVNNCSRGRQPAPSSPLAKMIGLTLNDTNYTIEIAALCRQNAPKRDK